LVEPLKYTEKNNIINLKCKEFSTFYPLEQMRYKGRILSQVLRIIFYELNFGKEIAM